MEIVPDPSTKISPVKFIGPTKEALYPSGTVADELNVCGFITIPSAIVNDPFIV
jgi:hypothetical protein